MRPFDNSAENTAAHPVAPGSGGSRPAGDEIAGLVLEPGEHLVFEVAGNLRVHPVDREWTSIGRSAASDIRFDDQTVSRRHALVVRRPDGLKIVDDRSLNGVFVNGERVEIHRLGDGDTVQVGRHSLHFVRVAVETPLSQALPPEVLHV